MEQGADGSGTRPECSARVGSLHRATVLAGQSGTRTGLFLRRTTSTVASRRSVPTGSSRVRTPELPQATARGAELPGTCIVAYGGRETRVSLKERLDSLFPLPTLACTWCCQLVWDESAPLCAAVCGAHGSEALASAVSTPAAVRPLPTALPHMTTPTSLELSGNPSQQKSTRPAETSRDTARSVSTSVTNCALFLAVRRHYPRWGCTKAASTTL